MNDHYSWSIEVDEHGNIERKADKRQTLIELEQEGVRFRPKNKKSAHYGNYLIVKNHIGGTTVYLPGTDRRWFTVGRCGLITWHVPEDIFLEVERIGLRVESDKVKKAPREVKTKKRKKARDFILCMLLPFLALVCLALAASGWAYLITRILIKAAMER